MVFFRQKLIWELDLETKGLGWFFCKSLRFKWIFIEGQGKSQVAESSTRWDHSGGKVLRKRPGVKAPMIHLKQPLKLGETLHHQGKYLSIFRGWFSNVTRCLGGWPFRSTHSLLGKMPSLTDQVSLKTWRVSLQGTINTCQSLGVDFPHVTFGACGPRLIRWSHYLFQWFKRISPIFVEAKRGRLPYLGDLRSA